ncbi:hypothetical protein SESBI_33032 [Sesbania bispinosa]|nr:hypothetical protein SESBI_33032 [Sesbania bispinosa]
MNVSEFDRNHSDASEEEMPENKWYKEQEPEEDALCNHCPKINVTKEEFEEWCKSWQDSLIVHFSAESDYKNAFFDGRKLGVLFKVDKLTSFHSNGKFSKITVEVQMLLAYESCHEILELAQEDDTENGVSKSFGSPSDERVKPITIENLMVASLLDGTKPRTTTEQKEKPKIDGP